MHPTAHPSLSLPTRLSHKPLFSISRWLHHTPVLSMPAWLPSKPASLMFKSKTVVIPKTTSPLQPALLSPLFSPMLISKEEPNQENMPLP